MTHITPERIDTLWKQAFDNTEAGGKTSHRFAALLFAEPAPVQEPVATVIKKGADREWMSERLASLPDGIYSLYTTPPAAKRQWVGLTEQEAAECWSTSTVRTWQAIEAKLKEKNT